MVVPVNVAPQPQPERAQTTKTPEPGPKPRFGEYPGLMVRSAALKRNYDRCDEPEMR